MYVQYVCICLSIYIYVIYICTYYFLFVFIHKVADLQTVAVPHFAKPYI